MFRRLMSNDPGPLGDGASYAHDRVPLEEELAAARAHPAYGIDVEAVEEALAEARADARRLKEELAAHEPQPKDRP